MLPQQVRGLKNLLLFFIFLLFLLLLLLLYFIPPHDICAHLSRDYGAFFFCSQNYTFVSSDQGKGQNLIEKKISSPGNGNPLSLSLSLSLCNRLLLRTLSAAVACAKSAFARAKLFGTITKTYPYGGRLCHFPDHII
jgi:hypothetical protein